MPRPKSILWVDDEVESLTSHIMFLEEQGFAVETSTHGDDALVLLQRQPYGVVLLDEQMPGRRGLDLFQAIRAIDHGMPVVMVTKSEETDTLKDAIGAEISDYLIKPVNPRQILSVVTRLLEGDRIRQQRLSRDFATRFRELEARRGGPLAWSWRSGRFGWARLTSLDCRTRLEHCRRACGRTLPAICSATTPTGSMKGAVTGLRSRSTSGPSFCGPSSTCTAG
jgi:CheY-like chemotaxis protein